MVFTILNVYGQLCFDPSLIFSTENLPQTEPAVTVMISTLRVYLATTIKRNELQTLIDLCHARFAKKQNFLDRKSGTNNIVSKDYLSMMVFHKSYESEDCWKARNAKKQSKISTGRTHKNLWNHKHRSGHIPPQSVFHNEVKFQHCLQCFNKFSSQRQVFAISNFASNLFKNKWCKISIKSIYQLKERSKPMIFRSLTNDGFSPQ